MAECPVEHSALCQIVYTEKVMNIPQFNSGFDFNMIAESNVAKYIRLLPNSFSAGAGDVSSWMLKFSALGICRILKSLFNHSLKSASFPISWKLVSSLPFIEKRLQI